MRRRLGDDLRWVQAATVRRSDGRGLFAIPGKVAHGTTGPFGNAEGLADLDAYDWPRPDDLDFGPALEALAHSGPVYIAPRGCGPVSTIT